MRYFNLVLILLIGLSCSKGEVIKVEDKEPEPTTPEQKEKFIRVLSYNIHHGAPAGNSPINLNAIEAVIRAQNPDLVALQEVDKNTDRAGLDQAKALGEKLGMSYFFSKSINYQNGEYGVAVLSKYPILDTEQVILSNNAAGGEQRTLGVVTVNVPEFGKLMLATAHLDLVLANRTAQVFEVNEFAKNAPYPLILAGDLNMTQFDNEFTPLRKEFLLSCIGSSCPLTFPVDKPIKEIDFIMMDNDAAKRLTVRSYDAIKNRPESDHLPLLAVLGFY